MAGYSEPEVSGIEIRRKREESVTDGGEEEMK